MMGIQFSITVADDRIEIARGACIFALDRSTAVHQDYEAAAGMAVASGFGVASDFIMSLAPSHDAMAASLVDHMEETPLEAYIERVNRGMVTPEQAVADEERVRRKFDRDRFIGQAKATRLKFGHSQGEIGKAIGVQQTAISAMETGNRNMADAKAIEIAKKVISHYSSAANEKPLPTRFGEVLRAARKAKHLSTEELGEQVGYARNYILKIEKDPYRAAPRETVEKIAAFLGVLNVERFWKEAA